MGQSSLPAGDGRADGHVAADVTSLETCSLMIGGPFHAVMARLGMLGPDALPTTRAAMVVGLIAWAGGALLAVVDWGSARTSAALAYLVDASVIAHTLVAVPVLLVSERRADLRLRRMIVQPVRRGFLDESHVARYARAVEAADRRSASRVAEVIVLLAAILVCLLQIQYVLRGNGPAWTLAMDVESGGSLSWAGWWTQAVVGPVLVFMLARWLFRYGVWTALLFRLARMRLALVPTHPDRAGGIGYLAIYPAVFFGPIFAMGAAIGAVLFSRSLDGRLVLEDVWVVLATWLVTLLILFIGPLLAFTPGLLDLRERAVLELGTRAIDANRTLIDAWRSLPHGLPKRTATTFDAAEIVAAGTLVDRAGSVSWLLVGRSTIVGFLAAASLPIVPAVLVHVPFERLVKIFVEGLI